MVIEISALNILAAISTIVGLTYAYWNLRAYLRLRRVVFRPRRPGAHQHGDSRSAETALLRRTFTQFVLWLLGTFTFVVFVLPKLVDAF